MKKILYITTVSATISTFLVPHIEMLLENGFKVDCACSICKEIDKSLIEKGVNIYNIPFSRNPLSLGNLKAFKKLIEIQKANQYDIVHVHTPIASIYGRLLKARFKSLKTIYTVHGYHFFKGASKSAWLLYYSIEKIMAKFTDVTININKEDYEITKNKLKPKKCYLVRGVGLDLNEYKPIDEMRKAKKRKELNLYKDDFIIIMIGELNQNKNQIQLIKALELLKNKYPKIKALCVGEGNKLQELKEEAKNRGIEENIKFLGLRRDVNELINIADIGILLSYREGLPRNIMELMANGRKVIATNIRGNKDLVCNDNVGTLVEVGDYKTTAKTIEKYCIQNNKDFVISQEIKAYNIENVVEQLKRIYKDI